MSSIETLNSALDRLIENYQTLQQENSSLKQDMANLQAEKDLIIEDLQSQLDHKSTELHALVNKISAALGQ